MGHCVTVTPERGFRFRHLSCLGNMDMDSDENKEKGMNQKMDPVTDKVKHVDRHKAVS
jgi:hypothetical protein